MIDPPKYPPHGYCPFEVETQGHKGWVCATPLCDDTDDLCADVWGTDLNGVGDWVPFRHYKGHEHTRSRICRFFETEEEATEACWDHAQTWWRGEPPEAPAIPHWHNRMAPGYRIFIEAEQRRMWLVKPDGSVTGEVSGVCLSSALDVYRDQTWQETHERHAEEQDEGNRERVRAWVQDDDPRRWELLRDDDGDYRPSLPAKHLVEMRIYMPHEMARDIEIIMAHCSGPRMGVQGYFKGWIDDGIRTCADEALTTMKEEEGGE
jgi:hypothetical protein